MRLPWPFGRSTTSHGPDASPARAPVDAARLGQPGAPALGSAAPAPPAPRTGAWATLPPIQRAIGRAPVVAPSEPFLAQVPGHTPLPPIVEPLGHESSPSAPAGLVHAQPRVVPSLTSSAPLPTRHVQRVPAPEPEPRPGPRVEAAPAGDPGPSGGNAESDAAEPSPVAGLDPVRTLGVVPPAATVTPPSRPLTESGELLPVPGRRPKPGSPSPAAGTAASSLASLPSAVPSGGGASDAQLPPPRAVSRWAEAATPGASRTTPAASAPHGPAPSDGSPSTAGRPSAGAGRAGGPIPRRAGLGTPMSVPPASAVAQRLPMRSAPRPIEGRQGPPTPGTSTPGAGLLDRPAGTWSASAGAGPIEPTRGAGRGTSSASPDGDVPPARPVARPGRSLPTLPVARRARPDGDAGPGPTAPTGPAGRAPAHGALSPGANATAAGGRAPAGPLGERPLRPVASIQRSIGRPASSPAPDAPVRTRWAADDLPPTVAGSVPVTVQTLGASVPLAPLDAPQGTSGFGMPGTPDGVVVPVPQWSQPWSSAGQPAGIGIQRVLATPGPWAPTADVAPGSSPPRVVGSAAHRGDGPLALVRGATPLSGAAAAGPAGTELRARGSAAASAPAPSPPAVVQTSPAVSPAATPAVPPIIATPVVQRVEGAAPTPEAPEGHSESELDELARALFGRIQTHLRAEVIHEREARGLTFDAF